MLACRISKILTESREKGQLKMTLNLFSTRRATASVWENNIWRLCTFANTARLPLLFLRKFGFSGKLLRVAIGVAVVAGPIIFGLLHVPQIQAQSASAAPTPSTLPSFDVASIKPDHSDSRRQKFSFDINSLTGSGLTLQSLIEFAYNVKDFQIHGGPGWANSETFEVQAKIDAATVEALNKLPRAQRQEQRRSMVQSLLADRFKLKVSHSSKELPIYALVLTKDGPKFSESASSANVDVGFWSTDAGTKAKGESMSDFANWLSRETGRKVVDNTGLQG